nr:hypothetical protein C4D60_Mb01t23160 [Ipomoea batatas]
MHACEIGKQLKSELGLHLQYGVSGVVELPLFLFSEMHVGDAHYAAPPQLRRQAEEDVAAINAVKASRKHRDWLDPSLVAENGSSQVSYGVADCPRGVAFQVDHLLTYELGVPKKALINDLYILSVYIKVVSNEGAEAGRVQVRARPNDAIRGEPRQLPGNRAVLLNEIKPGFPSVLSRTRRDDDQIRPRRDGVVDGGADLRAGEEGGGVLEVQHFAA